MQSAAMAEGENRPVVCSGVKETATLPACAPRQDYSLILEGYLRVPFAHEVIFKLGSADGSILILNGQRIIDNDEPHDYAEQLATVQLERGVYHLKLLYTSFRHAGELKLLMSNPAFEYAARFDAAKKERAQVSDELSDLKAQRLKVEYFIRTLEQQNVLVTKFDTELWYSTVDWMEMTKEQDIDVVFKGGYTVRVPMSDKHLRKKVV